MAQIPNRTKTLYDTGDIDLVGDTFRVALYNDTVAFSFDPDAHEFVSDILDGGTTAEEFGGSGGTGYSRKDLQSTIVSQDDTNDQSVFDAADITWTGLDGETIQGIICYRQIGGDDSTPGDDDVLFVYDDVDDDDLPYTTDGNDVPLEWPSDGIQLQTES